MNLQTIIMMERLSVIGLGIFQEMLNLIQRANAGEIITDAELEEGTKRVKDSVERLSLAANETPDPG